MSAAVTLLCAFPVSFAAPDTKNPAVFRQIAQECLDQLSDHDERMLKDARNMLSYAAEGCGIGMGRNGEMFTWGSVGNYSVVEDFIDVLKPFFTALYNKGYLFHGEAIIVLAQREQCPFMYQAEVRIPWKNRAPWSVDDLIVTAKGEQPFPLWGWHWERPDEHRLQG